MASREDINNQKTLNDEIKETKNLQEEVNNEFADSRDIFYESAKAMGRVKDQAKEAAKATSKLESIAQKLSLDAEEIVQRNDKQLAQQQDLALAASEQAKLAYTRLKGELGIEGTLAEQQKAISGLTEEQKELLAAGDSNFEQSEVFLSQINEEVEVRKNANKLLGTTGNILKGINSIAGNFGKAFGLDEVQTKMEKVAKAQAKAAKEAGRQVTALDKVKVAAAGVGEAFTQLGNNLLSPTVLLTNMVIGFNKVDKAATDFQQQTGQDLNTMSTSLAQFNGGLVTSAELIEAAGDVTKEFGINAAAAFGMEDIGEIASMKKELGLSSKEASK